MQRLHPKHWQQKNWLLRHDNAPFFAREVLIKEHNCHSLLTQLFSVCMIEDKNERLP
jgi:hypothetical protein